MRRVLLGLVAVAVFHLGLSALQAGSEVKKPSSQVQNVSVTTKKLSTMTPQSVGDRIAKLITRPGKSVPKTASTTTLNSPQTMSKALPAKLPAANMKPGYVPPPPRAAPPQIRQEIQKILDLDKKIKTLQAGRSAQMQRIQEQARIHQKILNELEATQKRAGTQKTLDKDALLAQEKLRLIHEETQRNAKTLDAIQKKSAEEAVKAPAKETSPAA